MSVPKSLKSDQLDDGAALTTPLSVTGAPKELDEQLARQSVEFVESHLGLFSTLKSAKEQMEAAAKGAGEAARKPTNSKSRSSKNSTPSTAKVQTECITKENSKDSRSSPAQRRQRLSTLRATTFSQVRVACLTLNRRTITEGRPTVLSRPTHYISSRRSRLWKHIAWTRICLQRGQAA
jgi:PRTRC genetic system protein E